MIVGLSCIIIFRSHYHLVQQVPAVQFWNHKQKFLRHLAEHIHFEIFVNQGLVFQIAPLYLNNLTLMSQNCYLLLLLVLF